jgi:hypothetical protein
VLGTHVVHGGDQGLLDLALRRGGTACRCQRAGDKRQNHANDDTNILGGLHRAAGCRVVETGAGLLDRR